MDRKNGTYVGVCAATIFAALAFTLPAFTPMRVFWYYPLQHRWAFEVKSTALAMDWYGRALFALAVAAPAFALGYLVAGRLKPLSLRGCALWAAWAATATVLSMSVYSYQLAARVPRPEPLPTWYVPR